MRNPTEQNYGKYIEGNGFLHLQKILAINMVKKLMDNATKTGIDGSKTASKWVIQKTAEATGDLIGNKIVDKTTSQGKTKSKEKQDERPEIDIPPEKKTANYCWLKILLIPYKNKIPKNYKLARYNIWSCT